MLHKMLKALAPVAFLVLAGCDCTYTLNPLVEPKDAVRQPALAGAWQQVGHKDRLVIEEKGPAEYELQDPDDDKEGTWQVRLIRINGELLGDFWQKAPSQGGTFLPAHMILRIRVDRDRLRLAPFNTKWLRSQITGPNGPPHADLDDGDIILTGSAQELQRFVGPYLYSSQAFGEEEEFQRVTDTRP